MKASLTSVNIQVSPEKGSGFTPRKTSPFWSERENGFLFDNCHDYKVDITKLAAEETGFEVVSYDLYYDFSFTVEVKDSFEIPHAMRKLEQFIDKHFKPWKPSK